MKDFSQKLRKKTIGFKEENPEISIAIVAAIILFIVGLVFIRFIEFDSGLSQNLLASLLGSFFDVLLFGILIVVINKRREKKLDIKRWQEEIDDYRRWDEKEAMFRIVGNIRRLNSLGTPDISLSYCFLKGADLQGTNLQEANLQETFLQEAFLQEANLWGANLRKTNLRKTNLQEADIRRAKYLTIEQLAEVKTLYMAKLDPDLEKEVREKYPHLLEKPKDEEENL